MTTGSSLASGRLPTVVVGGLPIALADGGLLLEVAAARLQAGQSTQFVTVNPEIVQHCKRNQRYRELVQAAELRTCDGVGVALAAWATSRQHLSRVTGVDLTERLLALAATRKLPLCVLGASEPSRKAFEKRAAAMGVPVCEGTSAIFDDLDPQPFVSAARPARLVLVALGVPKQEYLIGELRRRLEPPQVFVGVGGAVDYLSGFAARPPEIVRRLGLEWAFRLWSSRGARLDRQAGTIPAFAWAEILRPWAKSLIRPASPDAVRR